MVAPLPSARAVSATTWRHWLAIAVHVVVALGVPVAAWFLVPAADAWVRWVFALVPVLAWGGAALEVRLRGDSPWALLDPGRRPDARRWIYLAFDVLATIGYLIALRYLIPNRHDWAMALLYVLPVSTWLMAIGHALARPWSWWLVIAGGAAMLVWVVVVMLVLLYTASYLSGVYGAFGKAASTGILGAMAMLFEFVALLPAFELKWAMTRAGRRSFALAPLWSGRPRATAVSRAAA